MPERWPWQVSGVNAVLDLMRRGERSICVTSPTGMGKGRMIEDLVCKVLDIGGQAIVFTDRKMLTKQTGERFSDSGINFGYASREHGMDTRQNVIVASLQTIQSRVRRGKMNLPTSDLVVIDECHKRGFDYVIDAYNAQSDTEGRSRPCIVGFSASPVGLKEKYKHLVIAGTKQDGRACGALVPCRVIGMPSPDMRGVRMNVVGEYERKGMAKRVMQCTVFADIFNEWRKNAVTKHFGINGVWEATRPTLVWAPGVPESRWIVEEFRKRGVSAEHIDGKTPEAERTRIKEGSRHGNINIVSSYGVLREGIDWPWISYGILTQVCGAYETFVQLVGRILRAYDGKDNSILQDHSGAWWRHGSPNFDRQWSLEDTNQSIAEERAKRLAPPENGSDPKESEPICCPKCNGIRESGSQCPHCGFEHPKGIRMIRREDGTLVDMKADVKVKQKYSHLKKQWASALFRCGATGRTFSQAAWIFHKENGIWPQNCDECYPKPNNQQDWSKRVAELYPKYNRRLFARSASGGVGSF